jgi:hypothetical protein
MNAIEQNGKPQGEDEVIKKNWVKKRIIFLQLLAMVVITCSTLFWTLFQLLCFHLFYFIFQRINGG